LSTKRDVFEIHTQKNVFWKRNRTKKVLSQIAKFPPTSSFLLSSDLNGEKQRIHKNIFDKKIKIIKRL